MFRQKENQPIKIFLCSLIFLPQKLQTAPLLCVSTHYWYANISRRFNTPLKHCRRRKNVRLQSVHWSQQFWGFLNHALHVCQDSFAMFLSLHFAFIKTFSRPPCLIFFLQYFCCKLVYFYWPKMCIKCVISLTLFKVQEKKHCRPPAQQKLVLSIEALSSKITIQCSQFQWRPI